MAYNVLVQLADSHGLGRIVVCTGLSHDVVLHPMVHGEPLLTIQPFYYLNQLDAVAHIRYEDSAVPLSEPELAYLIDNYLFAFSVAHADSRMSARVGSPRFWVRDMSSLYALADERDTETIVLDHANDPSILEVRPVSPSDRIDLSGWDIGRYSAQPLLESHIAALEDLLRCKVFATILPSDNRDGYMGKLDVIKAGDGLLDYFQAQELEYLSTNAVPPAGDELSLSRTRDGNRRVVIPIERITATRSYEPVLLSHFFSGLKEVNPMKSFIGYYNVLEYYFEEAPLLLGVGARTERDQLECVLRLITTNADLQVFVSGLASDITSAFLAPLQTSSGVSIAPMAGNLGSVGCSQASKWLYEIRCAVIHSKKTRYGKSAATFEPYSDQAAHVKCALPLIRHLAVLLIDKDDSLRNPS